jgi:hypothetical protein
MEPTQVQPREESAAPVEQPQQHAPQPHHRPKQDRAPQQPKPHAQKQPKQQASNEPKKPDAHQLPAFLMRPVKLPDSKPKTAKPKAEVTES